jgi:hypothetical protein
MFERTMLVLKSAVSVALACAALAPPTRAGERFVYAPFTELRFEGAAPKLPLEQESRRMRMRPLPTNSMQVYAVLDIPGEVYLSV